MGKAGKRDVCFIPLKIDNQWMLWAVPNPAVLSLPRSMASSTPRPSWSCTGAPTTAAPAPTTSRCWCSVTSSTCSWWAPLLLLPLCPPRAPPGLSPDPCASLQVRVMSPYQGPPSESVVVKMIPDNRLPPRHLHAVHTGKTFAVIKWESPYDSPDQDMVTLSLLLSLCTQSPASDTALPSFCWRKPP